MQTLIRFTGISFIHMLLLYAGLVHLRKSAVCVHVLAGDAGECEEMPELSVHVDQAGVQWKAILRDHRQRQGAGQESAGTFLPPRL